MRWRISYSPAAAERSTLGMRVTVCPTLNLCITILSILISGCYISLAQAAGTPSKLQTVCSAESAPTKSDPMPSCHSRWFTAGAHQRARPQRYTNCRADAAYNDHQSEPSVLQCLFLQTRHPRAWIRID